MSGLFFQVADMWYWKTHATGVPCTVCNFWHDIQVDLFTQEVALLSDARTIPSTYLINRLACLNVNTRISIDLGLLRESFETFMGKIFFSCRIVSHSSRRGL